MTSTPRIDRLASEGLRLLNYNVEAQCTPSRSALLTGRFAVRSGTMRVNRGGALYGLTQWEITLAELLATQGYATGHFGKWHLGSTEGRFPTNQGFDEWYGIPNSTSVAPWTSFLLGKQDKSNREGFPCYVGDVLHAVKWCNWKVHFVWQEYMFDSPQPLPNPRVINLIEDPKERHVGGTLHTWVYHPVNKIVADFQASLKSESPIPVGAPDPYEPPQR